LKLTNIPDIYDRIDDVLDMFYTDFISVDSSNIKERILTHSANCTFLFALNAFAQKQLGVAELSLENTLNTAKISAKADMLSKGIKVTDKGVEVQADTDISVISSKTSLIDYRYKANLIKALSVGMQHQKDMLIQISANERADQKLQTE
jgi:hypothetical protein